MGVVQVSARLVVLQIGVETGTATVLVIMKHVIMMMAIAQMNVPLVVLTIGAEMHTAILLVIMRHVILTMAIASLHQQFMDLPSIRHHVLVWVLTTTSPMSVVPASLVVTNRTPFESIVDMAKL